MSNEVNIKSTTIEKGIELAKEFVSKLISPTIEEVGLLVSENIKYYRFKNQIRILEKAQKYIESKDIKIGKISTKILVPLLENASLEENEKMQYKWGVMIGNLADTEQNIQNQIFPYLLSQISINEYEQLLVFNEKEREYMIQHIELFDMRKKERWYLDKKYNNLKKIVNKIQQEGFSVNLEEYEYANLQRLGLIKQLPPKILIEEFETNSTEDGWHKIEAEYDPDDFGYRITSLGIKFLDICEEKKANN